MTGGVPGASTRPVTRAQSVRKPAASCSKISRPCSGPSAFRGSALEALISARKTRRARSSSGTSSDSAKERHREARSEARGGISAPLLCQSAWAPAASWSRTPAQGLQVALRRGSEGTGPSGPWDHKTIHSQPSTPRPWRHRGYAGGTRRRLGGGRRRLDGTEGGWAETVGG